LTRTAGLRTSFSDDTTGKIEAIEKLRRRAIWSAKGMIRHGMGEFTARYDKGMAQAFKEALAILRKK
jgi:hypothetical protein